MSVLEQIFAERRQDVERAKSEFSIDILKSVIAERDLPRGFLDSIVNRNKPVGLIAEIKPASPSRGVIKAGLDPALTAQHYAWAGAHALSVLTEPRHFGGSKENFVSARGACPLPVLRKDFIADPYQVYESRSWGADAILLIVAALSPDQLKGLHDLALELGMDVLVEVHTEPEVDVALAAGAKLVGVNNRNLATLETDFKVGESILPKLKGRAVTVAESALTNHSDVVRAEKAGADAVLIGTVFCEADDPESKVKEVMGW